MAELKHENGSVLSDVPDDQVERLLSFGWTKVEKAAKADSKKGDETPKPRSSSK